MIAEAVNLVVSIVKIPAPPGRRIAEVVAITGYAEGDYRVLEME